MPRKKDPIKSTRLRLGDLNIKLGQDPKLDALYYELVELKKRKMAGRTILHRLLTGTILESLSPAQNVDAAKAAANDILSMFMVDDE